MISTTRGSPRKYPSRSVSEKCCSQVSCGSRVPNTALMPPAARTVWASSRSRFPTTSTWLPACVAAIAARSPAAPAPMTRTLQTRLRADDSGISLGMLLRRLKSGVGALLSEGILQCRQVLDESGEILAGQAEHAGLRQGANGRGAAPVAESRDLAEVIPGSELADHLLVTVDKLEHLDLAGRDDVETPTELTLTHDRLAGAESHRHDGVAAADRERRQVAGPQSASQPVQHQPET